MSAAVTVNPRWWYRFATFFIDSASARLFLLATYSKVVNFILRDTLTTKASPLTNITSAATTLLTGPFVDRFPHRIALIVSQGLLAVALWFGPVVSSPGSLAIYGALTHRSIAESVQHFAGKPFSDFKAELAEVAVEHLGPIGTEMQRLMDDPGYVDGVLRDGAERAAAIADPILHEAQNLLGFLQV